MLLVDHHQSQTLEADAAVKQLVCADDDIHGAVRKATHDPGLSVTGAKSRELLDPHGQSANRSLNV